MAEQPDNPRMTSVECPRGHKRDAKPNQWDGRPVIDEDCERCFWEDNPTDPPE